MVPGLARGRSLLLGTLLLGGAVVAGRSTDSRLDPVAWDAPDAPPLTGPLEPNAELADLETVVSLDGPEDVAFDDEGRLYAGAADGAVHRTVDPVDRDTTDAASEVFAETDGRPLGLAFDGDDLLVAAAGAGLLSVAPDGEVTTLAATAGGRPIAFADDIHVAADGTVYVTDATVHDRFEDELWELRDTGRLLAYRPEDGEATVELEGLGFANGVVPGPDAFDGTGGEDSDGRGEDAESLLIAETSRYRVTRYWAAGDRAGEAEPFAEALVGFPDNVDVAGDGTYWVAVPSLRSDLLDALHRFPRLVRQLGKLPESATELSGDPYGLVLRLDAEGNVVESLHDPTGRVFGVTSATPHGGALYLGTLFGSSVVRYPFEG